MNNYSKIVKELLLLDKTNNIISIELQSNVENSVEINVIYKDYDAITKELWDYTLSFDTPELSIDNFGVEQEIPSAIDILFKREE